MTKNLAFKVTWKIGSQLKVDNITNFVICYKLFNSDYMIAPILQEWQPVPRATFDITEVSCITYFWLAANCYYFIQIKLQLHECAVRIKFSQIKCNNVTPCSLSNSLLIDGLIVTLKNFLFSGHSPSFLVTTNVVSSKMSYKFLRVILVFGYVEVAAVLNASASERTYLRKDLLLQERWLMQHFHGPSKLYDRERRLCSAN